MALVIIEYDDHLNQPAVPVEMMDERAGRSHADYMYARGGAAGIKRTSVYVRDEYYPDLWQLAYTTGPVEEE